MSKSLAAAGKTAKSGRFTNRNQNCTTGNQLSPLMARVKELLPQSKAAWQLHILTGQSISICQKVLSGHRRENLDMVLALLRSDHGWQVLRAAVGEEPAEWFKDLMDLADITAAKREQMRIQRDLARREQRLIDGGGLR